MEGEAPGAAAAAGGPGGGGKQGAAGAPRKVKARIGNAAEKIQILVGVQVGDWVAGWVYE